MLGEKVIMVEVLAGMRSGVATLSTILPVPRNEGDFALLWACVRVGLVAALESAFPGGGLVENLVADLALVEVTPRNVRRVERILAIDVLKAERWSVEVENGVHIAGLFNRYTLGQGGRNGEVK